MWPAVVAWIGALVLVAVSMRPKQQDQTPVAKDVKIPTNEEGTEIPVVFGTRDIDSPMNGWYGHLRTVPIRKKGGKK
ncbi:hypothetical protein H0A36_24070 [Endozoicomonas sp. SM1973]|uniref:Uncharacterized protein n=1 Tax=Spartinivicinus marinus TaxID=2994442 RepID=A0A853IGI7_9GAMM|nr:hypothetical protein [Spartinivicinus marinus]NYZ69101.1 hypothetical protein [Spartinivicinus marinus]